MLEIIPSVNETEWVLVKKRIESVALAADWIELDISDGTLGSVVTWNAPGDMANLHFTRPVRFAAHLMVRNPEEYIKPWIQAGSRRIIVQWEGIAPKGIGAIFHSSLSKRIAGLAQICKDNWVEFGISLGIHVEPKQADSILKFCDVVQILAGVPGPSKQAFHEPSLYRMVALVGLRTTKKLGFKTEWDIGVNPDTIESIKKSGADIIASTSFVFNSTDPIRALEYLKNKAKGLV